MSRRSRFRNRRGAEQTGIDAAADEPADGPLPEQAYLDAAWRHLDYQTSSFDVLDTRAVQVFSVGSAALPLTIALLSIGGATNVSCAVQWALGLGLGAYGVLLFCISRAVIVRGLVYRPDIATLRKHSEAVAGVVLLRWIANEYHASTELNERLLTRKSRWVGAASIVLCVEGVLLACAALLLVLQI